MKKHSREIVHAVSFLPPPLCLFAAKFHWYLQSLDCGFAALGLCPSVANPSDEVDRQQKYARLLRIAVLISVRRFQIFQISPLKIPNRKI